MQAIIKKKLFKYAEEKEEILSMFYLKSRNSSKEFTEVYTVVNEIIISKMQTEFSSIFDDVILTNKIKASFKVDKKDKQYTILEIFRDNSSKISENIVLEEFASDFVKNLPNDIEFIYDEMGLREEALAYRYVYNLPKAYEYEECIRNFFSQSLEASFYLIESNRIAALNKMQDIRNELSKMINWCVIDKNSKTRDSGKNQEFLATYLEEDFKNLYYDTFSSADLIEIYASIFKACRLFRKMGLILAKSLSFEYLKKEDVDCIKLLRENYKRVESLNN